MPFDKYAPEHELYGVLGDKETYKLLVPHHDKELLGRYPSYHPPESSTGNTHSHKSSASEDRSEKDRRSRPRPSFAAAEENAHHHLSQPVGVSDTGNSWYDKATEPPRTKKASNKLDRRPLAPSRPPPTTPSPPNEYPTSYIVPPPSNFVMTEPVEPFQRATKSPKSVLKNPNPAQSPPSSTPSSDISSSVSSGLRPAPLPATALLSPQAAQRRRMELQGRLGPPPSSMRPPSREPPATPYWMSPATSVGRLSSAPSATGSHRGSSAATSSVAYTSSSFSNSNNSNSTSYSYSLSNSASNTGRSIPDDDGEPDESPPPRATLFVVNADPDSASERSLPSPLAPHGPPHAPPYRPNVLKRHQKTMSAPVGFIPPVPALPPQFVPPPPPSYPPPGLSGPPADNRSRSAPTVPVVAQNDRANLKRNVSDNTSKHSYQASTPTPIPIQSKRNGSSSAAGSLSHSQSSSGSSDHRSPQTPPQITTGPEIPAEWVHPLPLTLEDLFRGGKREFRIARHMLDGTMKDQVVLVDVQPGWKSGTRITFPRAGNERAPGVYQDVIFVVEQVHHDRFARLDGGRLVVTEEIELPEAMNAGRRPQLRKIVGLDGKVIEFMPPSCVIKNGMETIVKGQGMYLRSKSQVIGRGDLIIRWNVRVPTNLTPGQYERMQEIFSK